jgi:CheY-like chemotaxis protein
MTCFETSMALLRPIADEKGLTLDLQVETELPKTVLGDPGRFRQIMLNLLGNAIKFTPKGEVTVLVSWDAMAQAMSIEVRDTGVGSAQNRIETRFEKFSQAESNTTRKFGGTGLGLTISRLLSEKMGGEISAKSTPGEGSSFFLRLPLCPTSSDDTGRSSEPRAVNPEVLNGLNILVAEDNRTNRLLIDKYLSKYNCTLTFAIDGAEAVEKARQLVPDVILMDISMPKLNGHAATRDIRATPDIKQPIIIALTANAFQSDKDDCIEAGMNGFLTKPIKKAELIRGIDECVHR